ncbi:SGNH/GDSL hydrolase family protein [Bifidobacterium sp. UBA744]|uniref:SGNH/GDSL hydrolase family protein n=1 Tax=Bifidobacterium sp. UBA744 TaxID=1946112 RepID=UPI0025BF8A99|nr:SGNH/GDSL hydrolase family protein [Bifidobacterium sp. UBA744]
MRILRPIISVITILFISLLPVTAYAETEEVNKIDLFLGDSTTSAIGVSSIQRWSKLFSDKDNAQEVNYAVGGSGWKDTKWVHDGRTYADQYAKARYALGNNAQYVHRVFVVGFVNDIQSGTSVQDIKTKMKDLLTTIHADLPKAQLIYIPEIAAPSPKNLSLLSKMLPVSEELINTAQGISGVYVADDCIDWLRDTSDTWQSDQTHPNAKGHEIVAQKVESLVAQIDSGSKKAGKIDNAESATPTDSNNTSLNYKQITLIVFIVIVLVSIILVLIISRKQKSKHGRH